MNKFYSVALALLSLTANAMYADTTTSPTISTYSNATLILKVSDNGKWAVAEGRGDEATCSKLINLETNEWSDILSSNNASDNGNATDVTNDGSKVSGSYADQPAIWDKATGVWTTLEMPAKAESGTVNAITPDGHYAVGVCWFSVYEEEAYLWDLTTNKLVETPNNIVLDAVGRNQKQNRFVGISDDGRYILGTKSVSYVGPWAKCSYVYDRQTSTYDVIGFIENIPSKEVSADDEKELWTPRVDGIHGIDDAYMSPSGNYVTGSAYMVKSLGDNSTNEYLVAYKYNVLTKEFEIYDTDLDADIYGTAIDDSGRIYGCSPAGTPIRDTYVRNGNYWYSIDDILTQRYGISLAERTGFDNTGTPVSVSGDGAVLAPFTDPNGYGYVLTMKESYEDACASVDLLGNYSYTPSDGSSFCSLSEMSVNFDRSVTVLGSRTDISLYDKDNKLVRSSMAANASSGKVTIIFRPTTLNEGEEYTVVIPAGFIGLSGDTKITNKEIRIKYIGRASTPVKPVSVFPANGSEISKLDYSSSNIIIAFDTDLKVTDNASALVYRNDDEEATATLNVYVSGKSMVLYPTTTLYLFDGNNYRIVLAAGSVTDLGNGGENEAYELNYTGSYVRQISADDKILFSEDFNEGLGSNLMFYEGDQNTPTTSMSALGFTQSTTPWWIARDDDNYDYAAMSHSSYSPAGTSDDWMVIPQIYVPDELCYMTFDSQSYRKAATDRLHVYVIPTSAVYSDLTTSRIEKFKELRELVYDEVESPGNNEEVLADEWKSNYISLSKYAGQDIYIAFVNENTDGSVIFVDNLQVIHDMNYLTSFDNEDVVTAQDNIVIHGRVQVTTDNKYSSANFELYDNEGNLIDQISEDGLDLAKDDIYSFSFNKPLPLEKGCINKYSVKVALGNESYTLSRSITNLAFKTTRRIVLEEYTGATCVNCPLGILAIDRLKEQLKDQFIPVSIHTYDNDALSAGLTSYSTFLGLNAAPSARINRGEDVVQPMSQNASGFTFNAADGQTPLWCDVVASELEELTTADINISATYDLENQIINVPISVNYAINTESQSISLYAVVLEDGLTYTQSNGYYTISDPALGEWGAGGSFGSKKVKNAIADDVVRACIGTSFNGTPGLLPMSYVANEPATTTLSFQIPQLVENIDNCHVVVMMIDNNTDKVINADNAKLYNLSGVNGTLANTSACKISVNEDGNLCVSTNGEASVAAYTISGICLANTSGQDVITSDLNGYKGIVIVRVADQAGITMKKIVIK